MKKLLMVGTMSVMVLGLAACGSGADSKSSESEDQTPKTEEKQVTKETDTAKQDVNSNEDTKEKTEAKQDKEEVTTKEDTPATDDTTQAKEDEATTPDQKVETPKTETAKKPAAATTAAFSLSADGFKQSAVAPKTGGTVALVYLNTTPQTADFGPLKVTVKQYKLESVTGANKKMDPYSPESYLANQDGFVVTADVIVENTTASNINYLAERIQINGGGISKGASLENFVPTAYQLSGSPSAHNIFPAKTKREGAITYMLNKQNYYTLVHLTKLIVPNPNDFAEKPLTTKTTKAIDLDFRITE
ncbi:DUF5068 domain-containing protein [Listeria newyorkensis]|uniref:DUF5068 domain-containing protein n=1 Tax=Listeria newyorkensis TaxID=1497681 RepID=A0A841YYC7_9LIST|nr:DUF5068 domain-containing protein [Listeria newyorkensis]MBC1458881.1 DUF5068 domain-containing protein [Listeria newyorkensis]